LYLLLIEENLFIGFHKHLEHLSGAISTSLIKDLV
jgi:hypothetical protein